VFLLPQWTVQGQAEKPAEIVLREGLVIPSVGRGGRSVVHTDAIEALIVAGEWKTPQAGGELRLPDGGVRKWEPAKAKNDGWFEQAALRGGYAFVSVPSDEQKVMILEASGHGLVYVNSEPRVGDPYETGYVRLPVLLRKGSNEFLFHVGRGRFRAKLLPPKASAQLDTGDLTLPDLVVGRESDELWGAIPVLNASEQSLDDMVIEARSEGKDVSISPAGRIPPLSLRKVPFKMSVAPPQAPGTHTIELRLISKEGAKPLLDETKIQLRVRLPTETQKHTFRSNIDESVQYFAVNRARPLPGAPAVRVGPGEAGLVVTLHGAGVEAIGQVDAYGAKPWTHIVAPTNRRPFGFDWEDWGRRDFEQVLYEAMLLVKPDLRRVYLTGHSMGGHGVWQIGAIFPDRFAAIAPSAGWISMYSYAGARRPENPDPRQEMLLRAAGTSDTLAMLKNYGLYGIYVLHGEKDDNVPVGQAREMRRHLATFHSDFVYYERPGAGHWWGNECVDWPPLFEFLQRRTLPELKDVRQVNFTTLNPVVSSTCHWLEIEAQETALRPSNVDIRFDPAAKGYVGTTDNVARMSIRVAATANDFLHVKKGDLLTVKLDGQEVFKTSGLEESFNLKFAREGRQWKQLQDVSKTLKGSHRSGPFKEAFRRGMVFVYGTRGTAEENAWAYAKARYDAETFWYRGNGSIEVTADSAYDRGKAGDGNVILYGNADTNSAWSSLLAESPVQVRRGGLKVGERTDKGDNLACLFLQRVPGTDYTCVAAISGTGLAGLRLTDRIPVFVSGVGIPDLLVLDSSMLTNGSDGIRVTGFFGNDWSVEKGELAWRP
jgi:pimeloyl-ACP methyl ester carboxylesterase